MSNLPWMFHTCITDAKIRQFEAALRTIAGIDSNRIAPEQAFATLAKAIAIARSALDRQGLAESGWEWIVDSPATAGR
jgi:hypothetical protein